MNKKDKLRLEFLNGNSFTTLSCRELIGTTELRAYVSRFKKEGLNIQSRWLTVKGERFKEYYLAKKYDFSHINFNKLNLVEA